MLCMVFTLLSPTDHCIYHITEMHYLLYAINGKNVAGFQKDYKTKVPDVRYPVVISL